MATLAVLVGLVLSIAWFKQSPERVEQSYSQGLFPLVGKLQQTLFGWVPFSVGDLFYAVVVIYGIRLLVRALRRVVAGYWEGAVFASLNLVNLILLLYVAFYALWGLNYFRVPLESQLGLERVQPSIADLMETAYAFVDSANALREQLDPRMLERENTEIYSEAARLVRNTAVLPTALLVHRPSAKSPLLNAFGNYMGVSGYFNPYTHEAHVNGSMPLWTRPFTACHELAHQAGIGFEDEANYLGFVLATRSDDVLFRYSAYYTTMWMMLGDVYRYDRSLYDRLLKRVSPLVRADAETHRAYWQRYTGIFNTLTEAFYGRYLEANNQPEGLERYDRMVRLVLAARRQRQGCD